MRSNHGSNWFNNHNSRDLRGPFKCGLCWCGWGLVGARAIKDCVFHFQRQKYTFPPWSYMQEPPNTYTHLGDGRIDNCNIVGQRNKNLSKSDKLIFYSSSDIKKLNKIETVSHGLYTCKSKGSHSVSKGHSLGCSIETQRSTSLTALRFTWDGNPGSTVLLYI